MSKFSYRILVVRPGGSSGFGGYSTYEEATAAIEAQRNSSWENAHNVYYIKEVEETETQRIVRTVSKICWVKSVEPVFEPPRVYDRSIFT